MTVSSLRPSSSTLLFGSITVFNDSTIHGALSDDSDGYIVFVESAGYAGCNGGLTDFTLPAGAVIKAIRARARAWMAPVYGDGYCSVGLAVGSVFYNGTVIIGSPSSADITFVTQAAPAGGWSDADMDGMLWSIQSYLFDPGNLRVSELWADVIHVLQPVADATAPTGTVSNTSRPTITWDRTLDGDGGDQTHYQVKLFSSAQYGAGGFDPSSSTATYDSGVLAGSALTNVPAEGIANATYRAYVRIAQTVNAQQHWSDWDYIGFTLSTDAPAAPDLTATPDPTNARITLTIAANSGSATTDYFELQRSLDGGSTWTPVRVLDRTDGITSDSTVYDYEAPNGTEVTYRARALHDYSGILSPSAAWTTAAATWESTIEWLKCPEIPALNAPIVISSLPETQRPARQGIFDVAGRAAPIVIDDVRSTERGTVALLVQSRAERDTLDALLATQATLLLQPSMLSDEPARYVRIADHTRTRGSDKGFVQATIDTLPWTQVESPAGPITAWP